MANVPISGLPAAVAPTGTDVLPIVEGGVTRKATINQVVAAGLSGGLVMAGDVTGVTNSSVVARLQGTAIENPLSPVLDEVLTWDGAKWVASPAPAGGVLTVVTPAAPGGTELINQNAAEGASTLANINSPAGEPATAATPYYLLVSDGTFSEHVVVINRSGSARTLAGPLRRSYLSGPGTVAYAGFATTPGVSGLMPAGSIHSLLAAAITAETRLANRQVSVTAPTAGQVLRWNATNVRWEPGVTILNNYAPAIGNPTVNDDSSQGYSIGSRWLDTTAGDASYTCLLPTVGAAIWFPYPIAKDAIEGVGASTSAGTDSTGFARVDHIHAHGNQAGGAQHADVIAATASGFMSGADKTKLNGIATSATADTPYASTPEAVGTGTPGPGASALFARGDHVHPFRFATRAITGTNATLTADDAVVTLDSSGASRTFTLPAHAAGLRLIIKDRVGTLDEFPLTVARASGGNIEGLAASYVYSVPFGALHLVSDGTDWHILGG